MAGSLTISTRSSPFSFHTPLKTGIFHPSSSSNCTESFSQVRELSASTLGSRDTRIFSGTCMPLRKSVIATCATTSAILESEGNFPSLYNLLGLDQDVTLPDIKTAYRQMARQFHPDVCPRENVEECTRIFLQVQDAYDTLSDPDRRAEYDYELSCTRIGGNPAWRFQERGTNRYSRSSTGRDYWRSKWEHQLDTLVERNATDHSSQSWGARMRRSNTQK